MELNNLEYPIIGSIISPPYLIETNPKFNQWDKFYDYFTVIIGGKWVEKFLKELSSICGYSHQRAGITLEHKVKKGYSFPFAVLDEYGEKRIDSEKVIIGTRILTSVKLKPWETIDKNNSRKSGIHFYFDWMRIIPDNLDEEGEIIEERIIDRGPKF
jgi:hypothetical protein